MLLHQDEGSLGSTVLSNLSPQLLDLLLSDAEGWDGDKVGLVAGIATVWGGSNLGCLRGRLLPVVGLGSDGLGGADLSATKYNPPRSMVVSPVTAKERAMRVIRVLFGESVCDDDGDGRKLRGAEGGVCGECFYRCIRKW